MKRLVTADQMRALDADTSANHGVPLAALMERAGSALAEAALELASPEGHFVILCGKGNNGGDGRVAARLLHAQGRAVFVQDVGGAEGLQGEAAASLAALRAAGVEPAPIPDALAPGPGDVVIDAIFGTGLTRAPEGEHADAVRRILGWREAGAKVVAADLPSGLSSDTGRPFDPCVQADLTVSFGLLKVGQVQEPARSLCGGLRVVDIGFPAAALQKLSAPAAWWVEESDARARVPVRRQDSHKGTYGHLLVVAGSRGKTGAAALTALAALRSGAGLVTVATRPDAVDAVLAHAPEVMGAPLGDGGPLGLQDLNALLEAADGKAAVVIGPGIPRGPDTGKLLVALLEEWEQPVVLDADALNAVAEQPGALQSAKCPLILTPHPGEMARLCQSSTVDVQADRAAAARALAQRLGAIVVLKGAATLSCLEDQTIYVNPTGNAGMATAGTGDVLSGVLGGLLAQRLAPEDAAISGVFAHGLAGELVSVRTGQQGLIARDLLEGLGEVWARWGR